MFSVERILVTVGIMLLTVLILNVNQSQNTHSSTVLFNESVISASALAQSMLDEIQSRAFDENTIVSAADAVTDLTVNASLGPDGGESNSTQFDDVDDYDGYGRVDTLTRLGTFNTAVDVYYVTKANPSASSGSRTFVKRIDVFITNAYLADTVKFNHLIAY